MTDETTNMKIMPTTSTLTFNDRLDHFLTRWGYRRAYHRVDPGLYSLGRPAPDSPVFVTANYTLSFDALRSNLKGVDCYILVLDTKGINVWCAAGKGTFGTEELMNRIKITGLANVVSHRRVILPQLGASGVSAFSLKEWCGWNVEYGPVRAEDLAEYLKMHKATPEMRRVRFSLWDRIQLIPVELVSGFLAMAVASIILYVILGLTAALAVLAAVLSGVVLFPILLPYIPVKDFSVKGLALGLLVALPFAYYVFTRPGDVTLNALAALGYLLAMPPVTAYLALNFTGCSTFTSRTGVRKEIFTYIMPMAVMFVIGVLIFIGLVAAHLLGVV
jgi:CO dehydrogenase/acetyl-CoA synthase delta subunit